MAGRADLAASRVTPNSNSTELLEVELLSIADVYRAEPPRPIFILGAPRTGSTILYQALVAAFRLPYFANLTNRYYPTRPIIGLSIQAAYPAHEQISATNRFGKV